MSSYTTTQGDKWDSISYKVYGTELYMSQLMQANPNHLTTVIFSAGISLKVPDLPPPIDNDLPPWKRVTGFEST